jgi:Ca2+-binding RTX toxin-like protein
MVLREVGALGRVASAFLPFGIKRLDGALGVLVVRFAILALQRLHSALWKRPLRHEDLLQPVLVEPRRTLSLRLLVDELENLVLDGSANIHGTGNSLANIITGNSGNNSLNGAVGADTLIGSGGKDTFFVDNVGDSLVGGADEDYVVSSITYTLGSGFEHLLLTGSDSIGGTGNASNNSITGNSGSNILTGGAGADTLIGGGGNDTFVIDADDVSIIGGTGTDVVRSDITINLSDAKFTAVDNIELTGTGNVNATGNNLVNLIAGNGGNNTLTGGDGADSLIGGGGNDTFVIDADDVAIIGGTGTDLVQTDASVDLSSARFTAVDNIELTGIGNINATGNSLANWITGNIGNNILTGGAGADTLIGGGGNDTFVIDAGDVSIIGGAGTDLVQSDASVDLSNARFINVDNIELTGTGNINATGNSLANLITGNSGVNLLRGGAGNDTVIGGDGADSLRGDAGNDTIYGADDDNLLDGGGQTDWLIIGSDFNDANDGQIINIENVLALTDGLTIDFSSQTENFAVTGFDTGSTTFVGGNGADTFTGGSGTDSINGGVGADWLSGTTASAAGANEIDTLTGGTGADTFILGDASNSYYNTAANAGDYVLITDFNTTDDLLQLRDLTGGVDPNGGYLFGGAIYGAIGGANSYLYVDTDGSTTVNAGDNLVAAISSNVALTTADLTTAKVLII